jgi:nicotinamide-nucleotide amidase
MSNSSIVFITGGLGPTNDDITKKVLTNYFKDELVLYPEIAKEIKDYFIAAKRPFTELNKEQAMLPKSAKIIRNDLGTASGMWFESMGKHIISIPGVPYEMMGLMNKILPLLQEQFPLGSFYHDTILFQGMVESVIAENISEIETDARKNNIGVAYLPSPGIVKVRFTATLDKKELIQKYIKHMSDDYPKFVFGYGEDKLEEVIGHILKNENKTLGTVESCTGGAIAKRLVSVSGSSAYFKGGIVSYANEIKSDVVGVAENTIEKNGAVSQEVVETMAKEGINKLSVDYCIATSGIAGPDGGTEEKPVGTVWIAIATKDKVYSKKFTFRHNRKRNIESSVVYGLSYLRRILLNLQD